MLIRRRPGADRSLRRHPEPPSCCTRSSRRRTKGSRWAFVGHGVLEAGTISLRRCPPGGRDRAERRSREQVRWSPARPGGPAGSVLPRTGLLPVVNPCCWAPLYRSRLYRDSSPVAFIGATLLAASTIATMFEYFRRPPACRARRTPRRAMGVFAGRVADRPKASSPPRSQLAWPLASDEERRQNPAVERRRTGPRPRGARPGAGHKHPSISTDGNSEMTSMCAGIYARAVLAQ